VKITREEVLRVAALARLDLSSEEQAALTEQLDKILQYMEKLNQLDTTNVEPLAHVVEMVNAFREDKVVAPFSPEALLSNAPAREKSFFKVPKIIE
jgi:aspartyl-tRNA(Asn)/glutamyl-tRNA(Gln) amidotransferase subunit C